MYYFLRLAVFSKPRRRGRFYDDENEVSHLIFLAKKNKSHLYFPLHCIRAYGVYLYILLNGSWEVITFSCVSEIFLLISNSGDAGYIFVDFIYFQRYSVFFLFFIFYCFFVVVVVKHNVVVTTIMCIYLYTSHCCLFLPH